METILRSALKGPLGMLFLATFFLALHIFSVIFINSSFLEQFGSLTGVSELYGVGALCAIGALIIAPSILRRVGVFSFAIMLAMIEVFIMLALGSATSFEIAAILFVGYWCISVLLLYALDILIESHIKLEQTTSLIHSIILSVANSALLLSPLIGSLLIENVGYFTAYVLGALSLIPFVAILILQFRNFTDPIYPKIALHGALKRLLHTRELRTIFSMHILLRIFFSASVIYLPLYLLEKGFSWPEVGIILSIMIVPLVLFEFPVGELARRSNEKILSILGFLLLALGVGLLGGVSSSNIAVFGLILFLAHTGAAILEVVTEGMFFKTVQGDDADLISFFRMLRPMGYVIAPLLGILLIPLLGFQGFFGVIALLLISGVAFALSLTISD